MEIIVQPNAEEASKLAARYVAQLLRSKANPVLGLATGGTPIPMYRELVRMHREDGLDFSTVTTFNLDEYAGLGSDHPASYRHYMQEHFFSKVNLDPSRAFLPDGLATDVAGECAAYEALIRQSGGIDLQVLGIGGEGHIGFNEATSSLASRTRIKTLTQRTREDNARFFGSLEQVPHHVITMGVGTILESRMCLLLAFGKGKAEAVAAMVEGPITSMVPASVLQMHPCVRVILDEEAASTLARLDYYRQVFAAKPAWQQV